MRSRVRRGTRPLTLFLRFLLVPLLFASVPPAASSPPERSAYVIGGNDSRLARVDLDSGVVTPALAALGGLPNRIVADGNAGLAVIVNSGSDDITLFDLASESVIGTVALPAGSNPWAAAIQPGRILVTCLLADRVYAVDPGTLAVVDSAATGRAPEGITVAGGRVWIANTGFDFTTFQYDPGTLTVLDAGTLAPVATVPVGLNPQECLSPDGQSVHVICTGDFGAVSGRVDVVDAISATVTGSLPVGGFPGGAIAAPGGARVYLTVTTSTFGSEIHAYDTATLAVLHDGTNPLLPTPGFYGNPDVTADGELLVPDFGADLLLREDPAAPGAPGAYLVGDGPVDVAFVARTPPVPLVLSGVTAANVDAGIELAWRASLEADVSGFRIERASGAAVALVAHDLAAARESRWTDTDVEAGERYRYRIGAVGFSGGTTWSSPVSVVRTPGAARLAFAAVRPNPSRGPVAFDLAVPEAGRLTVELFDVRGRRIAALRDVTVPAGPAAVDWDGRDDAGRTAGPGLYFARATIGGRTAFERVLRIR